MQKKLSLLIYNLFIKYGSVFSMLDMHSIWESTLILTLTDLAFLLNIIFFTRSPSLIRNVRLRVKHNSPSAIKDRRF